MGATEQGFVLEKLRLMTKPELLVGVPIFPGDVGRVFVLNQTGTAGEMYTLSELYLMDEHDLVRVSGWYQISETDVDSGQLPTADD